MSGRDGLVRVCLLDFPVELHRRASEHHEALRRELAFVEHAQATDAAPARLKVLTAEMIGRYGELTSAQHERVNAAIEAGEERIDLEYELPPEVVDATAYLGTLLDELDGLCREGDLLTMVTPPDLRAYREWVVGEFDRQIREGMPPRPWRGAAPAPEVPAEPDPSPACTRIEVHDDLDLSTAPALRKVLVDHLDAGGRRITLDLSGCGFMDSTGLSLLVTTQHRLAEVGGGLHLEGLSAPVRSALEIAGAIEFFEQA